MAAVEGLERLVAKLRSRAAQARRDGHPSVAVSFSTNYALFVHENLEAYHPVGQAKYLEQPARQMAPELGRIIFDAVRKGAPLAQALLLAGLRLQREAQKLTPVDTGALRASASTRLEGP